MPEFTSPAPAAAALRSADRRQRKKQRTRDALIRAAMELFEAKGYPDTPVHEITDAVDVSERTFFRYFTSKEDLVLAPIKDSAAQFARLLAQRPPGEDPFTAARCAYHALLAELAQAGGEHVSSYLAVIALIESTPALLAAHLRYTHEDDDHVVQVLAAREGVDARTDPRPRLLAATMGTIASLANRDWRASQDHSLATLAAAFDTYAGQLAAALAGHWS